MSGITNLAMSIGGSLAGSIGEQIGYGSGELTGYNKKLRKDQIDQQEKLTSIQYDANLGLMKESYKQQKALWDATNMEAQVEHIKKAGLNPALLYAKGGTGGSTGGGSASVGGSSASDESSRKIANIQSMGIWLSKGKVNL